MALFVRFLRNRQLHNVGVFIKRGEHIPTSSHKVNDWEKRFLVWTKKYKSVGEVPAYVPQNVMERARNRMRIKIANYMIAITALSCLAMVYLGKKSQERGESVMQMNIDWHKQYNEDAAKNDSKAT